MATIPLTPESKKKEKGRHITLNMEHHPLVCYGDQRSLTSALSSRDIDSFRRALHSPTEVEKYDNSTKLTIFEQACQTAGCAQFIEECILAGCDVDKLNSEFHKRPINFVVESEDIDNLSALLRDPGVDVNSKGSGLKTPINLLCEHISNENFRRIYPCIKLLIQHGADVNVPDKSEMTPITIILKSRKLDNSNKETIVKYLLMNAVEVDIDTYRKGEARKLLTKILPDIELLPNGSGKFQTNRQWDFHQLFIALKNEREEEFLDGLQFIAEKSPESLPELFTESENRETLLIVAVSKDLSKAIEKMIDLGADVNYFVSTTKNHRSPAEYACTFGHWRSLKLLLKSQELDINSAPLLPIVVRNIGMKATTKSDFQECLELLLEHPNIDLNQVDVTHSSALHYAAKSNDPTVALKLLENGAYIGVKNRFNHLPISNINPNLLEKHLDSCITTNENRRSDDNFEIHFDFKNLVCTQNAHIEHLTDEITAIEFISKSNDHKHLTMHPIIASFLSLKWNRLAPFFYINFILCALYALITVGYILMYYNDDESCTMKDVMRIIIFILTLYIAIREMAQFTFSPCTYLKSLENYLECALVVLVMLILFEVCTENWRRIYAATSILLIAIEIFLLAGSLPFWSFCTHFVMLKTVTWSFLKSLMLYAIILVAFSLSFFTLLHEPAKKKISTDDDSGEEDDFNQFSNLGLSLMKTLVMSTGEFDVASINFKANAFSYFVFLVFLFLVSIVLVNLLNGLAVNDTQVIKSEAELTSFIRRSQVLARYEGLLNNCPTLSKLIPFCIKIDAFEEPKSIHQIYIKPNVDNQIFVPGYDSYFEQTETDGTPLGCVRSLCCIGQCSHMDSKIVKLSIQVLDKKAITQQTEREKLQFNDRLTRMEQTLNNIAGNLSDLLNK